MMTRPTSISVMQWAKVFTLGSNHDPVDYLPKDLFSKNIELICDAQLF